MISIAIAVIWVAICIMRGIPAGLFAAGTVLLTLAAVASNCMFRPRHCGYMFSGEDYVLDTVFPLEVLPQSQGECRVYTLRQVSKTGAAYVVFRCAGKNGPPARVRALPRKAVRLIHDDIPHIRIYSAYRKLKGNVLLSILPGEASDFVAEIHTPDAAAAFSEDSTVRNYKRGKI